jgi:hypothetical protein
LLRDIFCAATGGGPTHDVEHEADEAMVRSERQQDTIDQNNVLEVVDDALAVEKVHCRPEEIPVQCLGEAQAPCATRDIGNCNDFFERNDLHSGDDDDDVDVAGEHASEKDTDHDEGPDHPRDEGLLLLLEVGQLLLLWLYPLSVLHPRRPDHPSCSPSRPHFPWPSRFELCLFFESRVALPL